MNDLLYIAITIAFFAVGLAYIKGCNKLQGDGSDE
jgi:hypothetical protein